MMRRRCSTSTRTGMPLIRFCRAMPGGATWIIRSKYRRGMMSGRVTGGFNQYGFTVGILMLDTRFPRIPGDMGNAATFPFPVRYHRVAGAVPDLVVRRGAEGLLPAFVDGARQLEREGVGAITTNCGFLIKFQRDLAAAVKVPVF